MPDKQSQQQFKPPVSEDFQKTPEALSFYLADEDVKLMLNFQKGDKASFEKIMVKYFKKILNFSYRFVNDQALAEDIAQETFIRVYKSGPNYYPKAKFQTWLYTIAKNICLNEIRKNKAASFSLQGALSTDEGEVSYQLADEKVKSPDKQVLEDEKKAAIRDAIGQLPENQRVAVLLRRYEQMSYEEIAQTMRTTTKAVKSLLSRAKENLKDSLMKYLE